MATVRYRNNITDDLSVTRGGNTGSDTKQNLYISAKRKWHRIA